jgi:peptidoglycan/xylan/chitin deacetylase (PgdA/CDA1 family)
MSATRLCTTIVAWLAVLLGGGGAGGLVPAARAQSPDGGAAAPSRKIVITVDDLPGRLRVRSLRNFQEVNRRVVAALKAAKVPAVGFVNEKPLHVTGERDARVALLRTWLDAGLTLGNHTFAHRSLSRTPLADYQDDVLRGEVITRQLMDERKLRLTWFRHPYVHSGPTLPIKQAFERFLTDRGYKVAPFTFDHSDWIHSTVYEQARADGDRALEQRVRREHLELFERTVIFYEGVSRELFGREVPQILLTHANRINADLMPQLLALLQKRGYAFVSLDEALADPAYAIADNYAGKGGMSWLYRWALTLGRPIKAGPGPRPAPDLVERYRIIDAKLGGNDDL